MVISLDQLISQVVTTAKRPEEGHKNNDNAISRSETIVLFAFRAHKINNLVSGRDERWRIQVAGNLRKCAIRSAFGLHVLHRLTDLPKNSPSLVFVKFLLARAHYRMRGNASSIGFWFQWNNDDDIGPTRVHSETMNEKEKQPMNMTMQ